MPKAVIDRVNQIGKDGPSILTFTNRHGEEIGDTTQDFDPVEDNKITGVEQVIEDPTGTDFHGEPTGVDFVAKPTGVEVEADHCEVYEPAPQEQENNGLGQQVLTPEVSAEPSSTQRSSRLTKQWKQPYIPSHKSTKYDVALTEVTAKYDVAMTQVTKAMQVANNATSLALLSIKLMSKGVA